MEYIWFISILLEYVEFSVLIHILMSNINARLYYVLVTLWQNKNTK